MKSKNETENKQIKLPKCLTTNYYLFHPASYSGSRRLNEERVLKEAEEFFKQIGFDVTKSEQTGITATRTFEGDDIKVIYNYQESAKNVYKTFKVYRNEEKKDIRLIKKMLKSL